MRPRPLFLWPITIPCSLLLVAVEVVMVGRLGPQHMLWLSHFALIGAVLALWTRSRLLGSVIAVGAGLPEFAWALDFLIGLPLGRSPTGSTAYMFDATVAIHLRITSGTFHLMLPPLLLLLLHHLGFDRRAWWIAILAIWVIFPLGWLFGAKRNINWTWGPEPLDIGWSGWVWLLAWMLIYPLLVVLPGHLILRFLWPRHARPASGASGH